MTDLATDGPVRTNRRRWLLVLRSGGSLALGVVLICFVFPAVVGAKWNAIEQQLANLTALDFAVLSAVWLIGLWVYTAVQTAALAGLTAVQALKLNLGGSAVSNLLPFGGAVGIGLNYAMARSWRFSKSAFGGFVALTNLANLFTKLALPSVAALVLLAAGQHLTPGLRVGVVASLVLLVMLAILLALVLGRESWAAAMERGAQRGLESTCRLFRVRRTFALDKALASVRQETRSRFSKRWPQFSMGMLGYSVLQMILLLLCLHMLHAGASFIAVIAAYATERLLTLAVITPGGAGLAETASVLVLVALGAHHDVAAAAVILYRGFTFLLEIPCGAAVIAGWMINKRRIAAASA
jgi:putative heme transporter